MEEIRNFIKSEDNENYNDIKMIDENRSLNREDIKEVAISNRK